MHPFTLRGLPFLLVLTLYLVPAVAIGQDAAGDAEADAAAADPAAGDTSAPAYPEIGGDVSLGVLATSGNTESESANADVDARVEYAVWRHRLRFAAYQASEEGETTAERYAGSVQSDYKFSERSYLFVNASHVEDEFGAFDRRTAVAAGVGRRFVETPTWQLDLEAGAGRREEEPAGTSESESEAIGRFRGELAWSFSEAGEFTQELQVESGSSNTYSESITAVKSRLVGALALRVAHTIQHNSDVPAGTEKTDTVTSVSLEWSF